MSNAPLTRPSLILRIRDPMDSEAWGQFADIYTPLVYRYAIRRGLQDADAADMAQDVFRAIASAAPKFEYDPNRGTFRSWLYTVARSKLNDHLARRQKHVQGSGETRVHRMLDNNASPEDEDESEWDLDYKRQLFDWAAQRVKPDFQENTWNAFWQTAVELKPSKDVGRALGMSVGAIYIAKSRVLTQIKQRIQDITDEEGIERPI